MKFSVMHIALFICLGFAVVSCAKKSESSLVDATVNEITTAKSENVELKDSAVILFNNAAVYEEQDGAMVYKTTANIGNVVRWKNLVKKAIRKSDGQEREFARIGIDKDDLWIQTPFVAAQAVPAVIIGDETVLYKKADAASPSGKTIAKHTIVAMHPDSASGNFVAISAYIDGDKAPMIAAQFVKKENVETNEGEVRALQLFTIAMASKDPVVRKELLKSALETNSRFSDLIQSELDTLTGASAASDPVTVGFAGTFTVNDDNVNVRDRPNEIAGKVIAQLSKGVTVNVTDMTSETFTIDGSTANWYKIAEPSGWVFGSFLSE